MSLSGGLHHNVMKFLPGVAEISRSQDREGREVRVSFTFKLQNRISSSLSGHLLNSKKFPQGVLTHDKNRTDRGMDMWIDGPPKNIKDQRRNPKLS